MGQINFDPDQARYLAGKLAAGAEGIASAPKINVTGGVRMSFTQQINKALHSVKTTANGNKGTYARWMQDYSDRMAQATTYQETFEEGVQMQLQAEQKKVEGTQQSYKPASSSSDKPKTIDRPVIDI
ncbi:hypothetical protein [Bifidobacterium leontopitheci]|uniref:Uncharacterized protein n=1 Tax=Bifidobacterium leontopitheci TaxID=2650774 RepID=A0A6I1GKK0_9BIFI|nr:hypothetical protein [Bifidobacterium leontopitheci]KAB7790166.1 hypothetical protein F7D09_1302 [Bifidobacterium leontopitheci]